MSKLTNSTTILTRLYDLSAQSGLLNVPWCQFMFQESYFWYKAHLEDPFLHLAERYPKLFQGGHVIDVGANIGYTALLFSRFISNGFQVFAFEPEYRNFDLLDAACRRYRLENKIVAVRAAVGAAEGVCTLWINKAHHADHRIATPTLRSMLPADEAAYVVPLVSIDEYMVAEEILGPVALIKLDVQGYEMPVCEGMERTIQNNPNACVVFEYAPDQMRDLGFNGYDLLKFFIDRGFHLYALARHAKLEPIAGMDVDRFLSKRRYFDVIAVREGLICAD